MFYASVFLCPMPHGVSYPHSFMLPQTSRLGSQEVSLAFEPQKVNGAVLMVHLCNTNC